MNTFYPENDYRNYLAHYGVKGMKWRKHKKDRNLMNNINDLVGGMTNNMAPNRRRAGSSDPRERYRTKATYGETNTPHTARPDWNHPRANRGDRHPAPQAPVSSTHNMIPYAKLGSDRVAAKHIRDHKVNTADHTEFRRSYSDWANNGQSRRRRPSRRSSTSHR